MAKLYVIKANTYDDAYGREYSIFGITDNEKDMETICEKVSKEGYFPEVEETILNQYNEVYIGGYCE